MNLKNTGSVTFFCAVLLVTCNINAMQKDDSYSNHGKSSKKKKKKLSKKNDDSLTKAIVVIVGAGALGGAVIATSGTYAFNIGKKFTTQQKISLHKNVKRNAGIGALVGAAASGGLTLGASLMIGTMDTVSIFSVVLIATMIIKR